MTSPNKSGTFFVRVANWQDELDRNALQQVRRQVFVEEQGVPEVLEWDAADAMATHLMVVDGQGEAIGTARFLPTGQIGRMAVILGWRSRGVGAALLREALHLLPSEPAPYLHAQVEAIGFYAGFGFAPRGDVFDDAGIPHCLMVLDIAHGSLVQGDNREGPGEREEHLAGCYSRSRKNPAG